MDNYDFDEIIARELQAEFDAEVAGITAGSTSSATIVHSISESDSDKTPSEDELEAIVSRTQRNAKRLAGCSSHDDLIAVEEKKPRLLTIDDNDKPLCQYGPKCYRKNEEHRKAFRHTIPEHQQKTNSRRFAFDQFYLTKVFGLQSIYNQPGLAISLKDILAENFGIFKSSAQFNYMFDVEWLLQQYPAENRNKPLLLVHGERHNSKKILEKQASSYEQIRLCQAPIPDAFGTHHTKMMFLLYEQGLRVVIHTANLVENDWHQKTQGVWISSLFPKLTATSAADDGSGDSETNFKRDLLSYLACYSRRDVEQWSTIVRGHDFSSANVCVIASTPGRHSGTTLFGHLKLRSILSGPKGPDANIVDHNWPVVGQFSSIGSLGVDDNVWLCGEWLESLASTRSTASRTLQLRRPSKLLNLVFPSVDNVCMSLQGYPAGSSLPYSKENDAKQPWLRKFFHQWKSENHGRSLASPHIKTYLRTSPDQSRIAWMLITSANLSKAAWGNLEKRGSQLHIRSYELGVLLLPSYCPPQQDQSTRETFGIGDIMVPFDLPLTRYTHKDRPWTWNSAHTDKPDRHGNVWQPS